LGGKGKGKGERGKGKGKGKRKREVLGVLGGGRFFVLVWRRGEERESFFLFLVLCV